MVMTMSVCARATRQHWSRHFEITDPSALFSKVTEISVLRRNFAHRHQTCQFVMSVSDPFMPAKGKILLSPIQDPLQCPPTMLHSNKCEAPYIKSNQWFPPYKQTVGQTLYPHHSFRCLTSCFVTVAHFSGLARSKKHSLGLCSNMPARPLLSKQQGPFGTHHHMQSSYSATRAVLESSPASVQPYMKLIRFDRPIGTWLLYWPCTWSIALAAPPGCMPDVKLLALFGAGAFFMRGAGCIINDMWDKDYDTKVERTKLRPLATGEITSFQALVFLGTQLSCALAILLQLNWYSVFLGAASMGLVILYPLAKRFTYWPQLVLGLTLNWGVLLGWSQLHGSLDPPALLLYAACTLYTVIYDTIYSHQDKYDDLLIGVKSSALLLGENTKPWLTGFTLAMTGGLTTVGILCDMTFPYYMAVGITGARLAQQIFSTDLNDADDCAKAFRGNFYLGAMMFAGIVLANAFKAKESTEDDGDKESSE